MRRFAIVGAGISGLAAAYEMELARRRGADLDWQIYEAADRLGGIVETVRHTTADGEFVLEGGPDGWVTEKPWARDLAIELGLESQILHSNDDGRKTYILLDGRLVPMPDDMRLMVPEDLATLDDSPLLTPAARSAYAAEPARADELKAAAPQADESVASFVRRHFGEEVLAKIGAPLLSGVFGGDVERLSVRSVLPGFVTMERERGSLIAALQAQARARGGKPRQPIFTSLRQGLGTLIDAIEGQLPSERMHRNRAALSLKREGGQWCLRTSAPTGKGRPGTSKRHFHHILLATPVDATRALLAPRDPVAADLLPRHASSAVLAVLCWSPEAAQTFSVPCGFGFLAPQDAATSAATSAAASTSAGRRHPLLAATFVDQKFPHRAPPGARVLRVFFGGRAADDLAPQSDAAIAAESLAQLAPALGALPPPDPNLTTVRRWRHGLPQYEVGHIERIAALDRRIADLGGLTLLGNAYRGVGLPDLIRDARSAVRSLLSSKG